MIYLLLLFQLIFLSIATHFECQKYGLNHNHYQDIILNNTIVCPGYGQNCELRYKAIKEHVLNRFKRPFTVLDIGAAEGYMSFNIAHQYDSCCVMIEAPESAHNIATLCTLNNLPNIILLKVKIDIEHLKNLAECEHFDVVLCLNIVHHFGSKWQEALDAMINLGDHLIIENPPSTKDKSTYGTEYLEDINKYIASLNPTTICSVPRWSNNEMISSTLWLEKPKTKLIKPSWFTGPAKEPYEIYSDFTSKYLKKVILDKEVIQLWKKGINLTTFKVLNGVFPTPITLVSSLHKYIKQDSHPDCLPHNIVIEGEKLVLIDEDFRYSINTGWPCDYMFKKLLAFVQVESKDAENLELIRKLNR